ncbi:MAG: DUF21 domain-containing protein [Deltaproteobacteria bacterium]|uniref:CNNM domain-containing protein n=1 Tax=Desulfobacula sp. TaxID=2593537 RepID=UPI0019C538AC|nr:DUF21 domain-containing protein [Candidatus Desulfobacula maris]MBL6994380.1 DUF21 domain-containing protein [Desulfobacula sp.]
MPTWTTDLINIIFAFLLVAINGFFVSAEFALVKVRPARLDEQAEKKVPFAAVPLRGKLNRFTLHHDKNRPTRVYNNRETAA